ncbi:MAG: MFS transporter, partial [Chloroflexi bacterium]|nr:MFS transporter [Chloroflexota bacterium]
VCALLIWIATYKIKERPEFSQVDKPIPLKEALKATLTNKNFIIFDIANFMAVFMFSICMGAIFYVSDYVTQSSSLYILAALFIPLAISVPLTKYALKRFESVGTFQVYMVICGVGLLLTALLPPSWIYLGMAIVGFGYAGILVGLNLSLGTIIDEDEVRTGVRREGSYFGANALITKPAESIAAPLTAAVLAATGFITRESNAGQIFLNQPDSAIWGIRMIIGLIPGIAMLLGAAVLRFFPLKGQKLKDMKAKVLEMHAEKEAQLAELESPSSEIINQD